MKSTDPVLEKPHMYAVVGSPHRVFLVTANTAWKPLPAVISLNE